MSGDRDCLMGHDWCDGPDGALVGDEAFGGLCGDCFVKRERKQSINHAGSEGDV